MSAAERAGGVRLVRAPRTVPLYEDEAAEGSHAASARLVPGSWGVEVPLPFDRGEQDASVRWLADHQRRRRRDGAAASPTNPRTRPDGSPPAVPSAPPLTREESQRLARGFLQALVEIATGRRPRHQLRGRISQESLSSVEQLTGTAKACAASGSRMALGGVTASQPTPWAVEFAAVVRTGRRNRALAGRLEMQHRRWVCTALAVVGS